MQDSKQHTPGPWALTYGPNPHRWNIFSVDKHVGTFTPGGMKDGDVNEANANIMAAAPDLLIALEAAADELNRIGNALSAKGQGATQTGMIERRVRAAIAKARGE